MFQIPNAWALFCICFGIMLLATFIMGLQGRNLYTMDVVRRKFSLIDLAFASKPIEIVNTISGIFLLSQDEKTQVIKSLKRQLLTDFFIFMPATYGGIFILCMNLALKMGSIGYWGFLILAWLQILAFVLDTIENIYLWLKIKPGITATTNGTHKVWLVIELLKWGLALLGAIGGFSALCYFWLSGYYAPTSLPYFYILAGELWGFLILGIVIKSTSKPADD